MFCDELCWKKKKITDRDLLSFSKFFNFVRRGLKTQLLFCHEHFCAHSQYDLYNISQILPLTVTQNVSFVSATLKSLKHASYTEYRLVDSERIFIPFS
ncbi:hypothetical protein QVD17_27032 [Tagetes erecta]|uniref:Uncharacterized protein n=1 Tax=Tagetes erecta TaxID=13708 RepID=A0AAD8KCD1_TARER|nr:hypothetical protein QVD17_27032 [Tagetes erecta]